MQLVHFLSQKKHNKKYSKEQKPTDDLTSYKTGQNTLGTKDC